MLRIYLVRHGQTTYNISNKIHGWSESSLTQLGIEQAINVGRNLQNFEFDICYCSDKMRTIETANLILKQRNIKIIPTSNLREINFGDFENKNTKKLLDIDEETKMIGFRKYHGEDLEDVRNRLKILLDDLILKYENGNILIISHGRTIMTLLNILDSSIENNFTLSGRTKTVDNCSVSILEYNNHQWKILSIGDISYRNNNNSYFK